VPIGPWLAPEIPLPHFADAGFRFGRRLRHIPHIAYDKQELKGYGAG